MASSSLKTLEDAFVHELQDILSAEQQIIKALPKMAKKAADPELKETFELHLRQSEEQANRVQRAFDSIGRSGKAEKCEGMGGILKEGQELMSIAGEPEVLDAELIASAQKAEHYEIAAYGTVCEWAEQLGYIEAHDLLGQNLAEQKVADQRLTTLARKSINIEAEGQHGFDLEDIDE